MGINDSPCPTNYKTQRTFLRRRTAKSQGGRYLLMILRPTSPHLSQFTKMRIGPLSSPVEETGEDAILCLAFDQSLGQACHAFRLNIGKGETQIIFLAGAEHGAGEAEEVVFFGEAHGDGF